MNITAGRWDPKEPPFYFIAGSLTWVCEASDIVNRVLIAVNEINSAKGKMKLTGMIAAGCHVLIDSGVYSLAASTAAVRGITHDAALRMPIDQLDGFNELFNRYCDIAKACQETAWGLVEVDLGGRDQKIKTRTKLEAMGIRPIPVYHPLNDGWEYFDYLAKNYDRICVGNIVNASQYVRLRLLSTIWERKLRVNPDLWVHMLGLTPNESLCAYPVNSADSSSWLNTVRWDGYMERANLRTIGKLHKNFQYELGDTESGRQGVRMGAVGTAFIRRNWNLYLNAMKEVGLYENPRILYNAIRRLPPMARRAAARRVLTGSAPTPLSR